MATATLSLNSVKSSTQATSPRQLLDRADRESSLQNFNSPPSKPLYRGLAAIDFAQANVKAELDLEELKNEYKRTQSLK